MIVGVALLVYLGEVCGFLYRQMVIIVIFVCFRFDFLEEFEILCNLKE